VRTFPLPRLAAGLGAAALALTLSACGGSDPVGSAADTATGSSASSSAATGTQVTAVEADFSIELSSRDLTAGSYTFLVRNDGSATHSLEIEGPGLDDAVSDTVQAGESTTLTVTLQPGEYEVYCPIADHRAMGMDTTLTVS